MCIDPSDSMVVLHNFAGSFEPNSDRSIYIRTWYIMPLDIHVHTRMHVTKLDT